MWVDVIHNGRTPLLIFERGTVTSQRYYGKLIMDPVCLFRGTMRPGFLFKDDNAHPQWTTEVSDTLESENTKCFEWPVYSPDLNPIANARNALGRSLSQIIYLPQNVQDLKSALREEWDNIPQGLANCLAESLSNMKAK